MSGNNLTFKDFTIDYDKTRGGKVIYWSDRGIDLKTKERPDGTMKQKRSRSCLFICTHCMLSWRKLNVDTLLLWNDVFYYSAKSSACTTVNQFCANKIFYFFKFVYIYI